MGLFGGGNSSSRTFYETNNIDNSQNLADSNILGAGAVQQGLGSTFTAVDSGGILADELNQYESTSTSSSNNTTTRTDITTKTGSDNISISGDGVTYQGFSDSVASVLSGAIEQLGNVSNSIGASLLAEETEPSTMPKMTTSGGMKINAKMLAVLGLGIAGVYWYRKKKGK